MTTKKAVTIAVIGSAFLVSVARVLSPFEIAFADWILFPGGIADIFRTHSVHGGFHGLSSEITTEGVSFLVWFVAILATLGLWWLVESCVRK